MDKTSFRVLHSIFMFIYCVAIGARSDLWNDFIAVPALANHDIYDFILRVYGRQYILVAFQFRHVPFNLIIKGYIKSYLSVTLTPEISPHLPKPLFMLRLYHNNEVKCLTEHISSKIDYLRALETACLKCGDKHRADCPVGMAKAQINCTNDVITEFYKHR